MLIQRHIFACLVGLPMYVWAGTAQVAEPLLVIGHMNPDTDSICSAIAVAHLKTVQGVEAQAVAQGPANAETRYVLDSFHLPQLPIVTHVTGRQVFLVDHSDYTQAPADLKSAELVGFSDHHKLGGLTSDRPVEVWAAPFGACGTVVTRMYDVAGVEIPAHVAGCLLATILSDTVRFKSATTTVHDKETAARLAKIAGVTDIDRMGREMLEAKSDIRGISPVMLLSSDLKTFDMHGRKIAISQIELKSLMQVKPIREALLKEMQGLKRNGYHSVFLMLTDVSQEATDLLFVSDEPLIVQKAWGLQTQGNSVWMPGVMSRKSQIVPALQKAFE
ncbi:manganese-dependent inorganic pyrophosphatase [Aeromonas sobria]|jgi:manganese-dependent inorganic pyrophosphatase|nr:manganese-dependent inorganic pyrophosphatase [Aeromonas sobria]